MQTEDKQHGELTHLRRIDTFEEIASMIEHELNQPLCAIMNYSGVCMKLLKDSENKQGRMTDAMAEISNQAKRAGQIIQSLRRLVTHLKPRLSAVHINNDIVQEVVRITQAEACQNNISVRTQLAANLPEIFVDKIQIVQVLLNLVRNAFDAMHDIQVDQRHLTIITLLTEEDSIEMRVCDTGEGLSDDIAGRIFDIYFTTKPVGLGIGLSLCRRIVEAHGGKIWVENNPDIGATFGFTLPFNEVMQHGKFQTNSICCR